MRLKEHPWSGRLLRACAEAARFAAKFEGVIYRAVSPRYAASRDAISGLGAKKYGGRWNPPGEFAAVYGALDPETAMAEALAVQRHYGLPVHGAFPRVFLAVECRLERVVDVTDAKVERALGVNLAGLVELDWRAANDTGSESLSQAVGRAAFAAKWEGMVLPSARAAEGRIAAIFPDHLGGGSTVRVLAG